MKLMNIKEDEVLLEVKTTGKTTIDLYFPKRNIHHWYPLNLNFYYQYSNSRQFLYLVKDKHYEGINYYDVDILKRTKPLAQRNNVPFHPLVYKRNRQIMARASLIGVPTLDGVYTAEDVSTGFYTLSEFMTAFKERIEERYIQGSEDPLRKQSTPSDEWDKVIYGTMTELEKAIMIELGEIYCMLTIMRKLSEQQEGI